MARTINEIKQEITDAFMANETLAGLYNFTPGASWDDTFSKVSIDNLICYVVATVIYTLERLFDLHKQELSDLLETKKPHTLKWYVEKALAFQYGRPLQPDSDIYDEIVESEKIVKYASAVEYHGKLFIKTAKGTDKTKEPLTPDELTALKTYFAEIKDAGVKLEVISNPADHFAIEIDVYYNPMILDANGYRLDTSEDVVRNTIRDYVENRIPFNGQYQNVLLVDELQKIDGVIIPEIKSAKSVSHAAYMENPDNPPWISINAWHNPESGYYKIYDDNDLIINFIAYSNSDDK